MLMPLHDTTLMSFEMERPLNKAHSYEREAEKQLQNKKWDDAERNYKLAAEMMRKALDEVSTPSMTLSLQVQAEKLEQMKHVIDIKRKESSQEKTTKNESARSVDRSNVAQFSPERRKQSPKLPSTKETTRDKSTEVSALSQRKPQPNTLASIAPGTWDFLPNDLMTILEERETDSLLQFLYLPVNEEEDETLSNSTVRRKKPKSQEEVLEQYKTRLHLLQKTAEALIKALDDKDKENEMLKSQIGELKIENSRLHNQLEVYEDNQCYTGLHYTQEKPDLSKSKEELPGVMMASMLIDQPESYFEFNQKELETELVDATRDFQLSDNSTNTFKNRRTSPDKDRRILTDSVQYEDLDDGSCNDAFDGTSNSDSNTTDSSQLQFASLAGLPPLSPVHFEVDDDDNINCA